MKKNFKIFQLGFIILVSSCNHFLEEKPDIKMVIPQTLADADLLLNDYTTLNNGYPIYGELGNDDFFISKESWDATSNMDQRNAYIWADEPYADVVQWQRPYKTIYIANQVLEMLSKIHPSENPEQYNRTMGAAYFYRAFALHQLAEVHTPAYEAGTASEELGIPLRLDAGIDVRSLRATLKITYDRIVSDFKEAAYSLPAFEAVKGRPFKGSAYAGLARAYLDMGDYDHAFLHADSCLRLNPDLMDFNILKSSDNLPIPRFNVEVLFSAMSINAGILGLNTALVDSVLYDTYDDNDLRKSIFMEPSPMMQSSYRYKGNYDKTSASLFVGITTSELYLIKAEAAVRTGRINESLASINTLLKTRWKKNTFSNITETDPERLLKFILDERRKELLFRGRRWADLKRLNLDTRFRKTLVRNLGGTEYSLEPNSSKYAYRLSETVVDLAGIPQNKR